MVVSEGCVTEKEAQKIYDAEMEEFGGT